MTKLEWLHKNSPILNCPNHGGQIPGSWVKMTAWCRVCRAFWRLKGRTHSWKPIWSPNVKTEEKTDESL